MAKEKYYRMYINNDVVYLSSKKGKLCIGSNNFLGRLKLEELSKWGYDDGVSDLEHSSGHQ